MTNFALNVFFAYAREDAEIRSKLSNHLAPLRRNNYISEWYDGEILGGEQWDEVIKDKLNAADIILILVSSDFIASQYAFTFEFSNALERHEHSLAVIIPIIVRPCAWQETPVKKIQLLPKGGAPIMGTGKWQSEDEAFTNVAEGVNRIVKKLLKERGLLEDNRTQQDFENLQSAQAFYSQFSKYDRMLFEVQDENEQLKQLLPRKEKDILALKDKIRSLQRRLSDKDNEISVLNERLKRLEAKFSELTVRLQSSQNEKLKLHQELVETVEDLSALLLLDKTALPLISVKKSEILQLEEKLKTYKERLKNFKATRKWFDVWPSEEENALKLMIENTTNHINHLKIEFTNIFLRQESKE
jgi:predicted RNase H-like nuclease (RuvC/YqgF family)